MNRKSTEQIKSTPLMEALRKSMLEVMQEKDLSDYRSLVRNVSIQLNVDVMDFAAVLLYLHQECQQQQRNPQTTTTHHKTAQQVIAEQHGAQIRMVRYRMEVGRKHKISIQEIKQILVDESGVEDRLIGFIDMRSEYTLVSLPEGMPSDIFYHLKTLKLNQQSLGFKRVGKRSNSKGVKAKQRSRRRVSS
jgi:DbpA-like RNA binding protein